MSPIVPLPERMRAKANHLTSWGEPRSETERLLREGADRIEELLDRLHDAEARFNEILNYAVEGAQHASAAAELLAALRTAHAQLVKIADGCAAGVEVQVDPGVVDQIETVLGVSSQKEEA